MTKQQEGDVIIFPKYYEELWNRGKGNDIHGAQALIVDHIKPCRSRITTASQQRRPFADDLELQRISRQKYLHIVHLLKDVKDHVFHGAHKSYIPGSLLQRMRFVFLKSRIPGKEDTTGLYKEIHAFYFDPTIYRQGDLHNRTEGGVQKLGLIYSYPVAPLHIVIVGGGPGGLVTAINLYERFHTQTTVEIHIFDKRWAFVHGRYEFVSKRRPQIVTIQDGVCQRLSVQTEAAFFGSLIHERVWPHSRNISIMKIEDHLLQAVQSDDMKRVIHLHTLEVHPTDLTNLGPFHLLISAEGFHSKIREHFFSPETNVKSKGYAMGISFHYPEIPRPNTQALNVFLTLAQSRYLLNSSLSEQRGLLNIQLTRAEWDQVTRTDGERCTFGKPGKISMSTKQYSPAESDNTGETFKPSMLGNELWKCIQDGLQLFGIHEEDVTEIMGIPINDRACTTGCKAITSRVRPNALVFVVGDSALSLHVWPGRGLNSGLKTAIACADVIASAVQTKQVIDLTPSSFSKYTEYLNRLETREHEGRTLFVVNQSGDPDILHRKLNLESALIPDAASKFVEEVCKIAKRMEDRRDWTHAKVQDLESIIRNSIDHMSTMNVQDMIATGPWPIDKMTGPEVYPVLEYQPIGRDSLGVCCIRNNQRDSSMAKKTSEADINRNELLNSGPVEDLAQDPDTDQRYRNPVANRLVVTCTC